MNKQVLESIYYHEQTSRGNQVAGLIVFRVTKKQKMLLSIDPFTVSVAILVRGQSRLKLQQMHGKLFNFQTLKFRYCTTEFDKNRVF